MEGSTMAGAAAKKVEEVKDGGNGTGKAKYKPGQKSKWRQTRIDREIADLPRKVDLVRKGVPVRVKSTIVAYITGEALKTVESDRLRGKGLPFKVDDRGMVFYNLADVLKHVEGTDEKKPDETSASR
jgi:hypothetical protein